MRKLSGDSDGVVCCRNLDGMTMTPILEFHWDFRKCYIMLQFCADLASRMKFSNNLHSRERLPRGQECAEAFHAFDDNRKDLVLFGWINSQISARERSLLNWSICEDSLKGAYVDPSVNLEIGLMRQRLRMKDFSKNSGCSLQT